MSNNRVRSLIASSKWCYFRFDSDCSCLWPISWLSCSTKRYFWRRVIFFWSVFFRLSYLQRLVSSFDLSIHSVDSIYVPLDSTKENVGAVCERHAGRGYRKTISVKWIEAEILWSRETYSVSEIGGRCCLTIDCYDRAAESSRGTIMIYLRLHVGRSLRCNTNARHWNVFIVPLFPLWIIGAFCVKDSEYKKLFCIEYYLVNFKRYIVIVY